MEAPVKVVFGVAIGFFFVLQMEYAGILKIIKLKYIHFRTQ